MSTSSTQDVTLSTHEISEDAQPHERLSSIPAPTVMIDVEVGQPFRVSSTAFTKSDSASPATEKDASSGEIGERSTFSSSVVTLGMSTMGIGILGLPSNFAKAGYIMAGFFVLMFAVLTDLSLILLVRVAKRTDRYSYEKLSDYYLGFWGVRYTNWSLIGALFFVTIAFLTIPNKTVESLVYSALENVQGVCKNTDNTFSKPVCNTAVPCPDGLECFTSGNALMGPCTADSASCFCEVGLTVKESVIGAIMAVFVGLVGLITSLHRIAPASTVSFGCLAVAIFLLFVIFLQQATGASNEQREPHEDESPLVPVAGFMMVVSGFGNVVIAFHCQYNVLQCYSEMKVPEKIDKLIHVTIFGIALPLYLFVAVLGLLSVRGEHAPNVFDSLNSKNNFPIAAKWLCVIMAVSKTPLIFNPLRDLVMAELKHIPALNFLELEKIKHRVVVSTTLVIGCYFLAWWIPLDEIMAFTGSCFAAPAAFILPGLYVLRDCNMHGLVDASDKPITGFAAFAPHWSAFTRQAKMDYCLGALSIAAGSLGAIAGIAGAINDLGTHTEPLSVPACA